MIIKIYSVNMFVYKYRGLVCFIFTVFSSQIKVIVANSCMLTIRYLAGLDTGDRQILEHRYASCELPCLLDSSDGR